MIELDELADVAVNFNASAAPGEADERAAAAMAIVTGHCANRELGEDEHAAIAAIALAAARFGKE